MFSVSRFLCLSAAVALSAGAGFAQSVISAKSGLVHYIEGDVSVAGTPVVDKAGVFAEVKKDEQLETGLGRAEILLTPGVFLRVGEQSAIRMVNTSLADTRVEMVTGKSMLEADTPMKGNLVTVLYKDYATTFVKHGLYEFQAAPAQVKVYSGEVQVTAGEQTVTVHEGHTLFFTAALAQERFDSKDGDSLYRWSKVRSEYLSIANVSAARYSSDAGNGNSFASSGYGYGLAGNGFGNWLYNNAYGMYTYVPYNGIAYSPFGFAYFSPFTVYQAYPQYYSNNYGSGGGSNYRVSHSQIVNSRTSNTGGFSRQGSSPTIASGSTGVGNVAVSGAGMSGGSASHGGGHGK